jgi:hypothetical protein
MKTLRIYLDTPVFGGFLDDEFADESQALFDLIRAGRFVLVISEVLLEELAAAPEAVQNVLAGLPTDYIEFLQNSLEIQRLRDAYLTEGILGPASRSDAEHVASASVAEVDFIVSWNFKHIVHYEKYLVSKRLIS